jgi:hypothetical protein
MAAGEVTGEMVSLVTARTLAKAVTQVTAAEPALEAKEVPVAKGE